MFFPPVVLAVVKPVTSELIMNQNKKKVDFVLLTNQQPENETLPPLWQTIYYEAVRSNHIMFEQNDVRSFTAETAEKMLSLNADERSNICDASMRILNASDLGSMREAIAELPYKQKKVLFAIYSNALLKFKEESKQNLH